ncbi:MAG: TetR/AcrR family transcriptional regulator [Clostridia bacterium]|nr:TetR/AcrR family transcriptional regulator [Clostridia bacterium]
MAGQEKGKREMILEAAIKVFVEKGFKDAKIEEIAQEANVGKGTVYEYFASKKELFMDMIKYTVEHYMERIKAQVLVAANSKEQLRLVALGHINYSNEYRQMYRVFIQDHSWIGQEFSLWMLKIWQKKVDGVEKILQAGINKGEFGEMDTRLTATMILGMLDGVCTPIIFTDVLIDPGETAEKILGLLLDGISGGAKS